MISVITIVHNEEKNIARCLDAVKWADEIVVVDQSSTDGTRDICSKYTDKIFVTEKKLMPEPDRALAESKASGEWILYVDADEVVTPELAAEIEDTISKPAYDVYNMARRNYFLGKWIKHCGWYPAYVPRLFRKGSVRFSDKLHVSTVPLSEAGYLKNDLIHYSYDSMEQYFEKFGRYTTLLARNIYGEGVRIRWYNAAWHLLVKPPAYFADRYFIKLGILDGWRGLTIAFLTAYTVFMQYLKLWKMERDGSAA